MTSKVKTSIYFSTAVNEVRKLILITKVNNTNNKLIFSYLIANERINDYGLNHSFAIKLNVFYVILLLCLLFLGVLIYQQCIYGYDLEHIFCNDLSK